MIKSITHFNIIIILIFVSATLVYSCPALDKKPLYRIKKAYPHFIKAVKKNSLIWTDGEIMIIDKNQLNNADTTPSLYDQLHQPSYPANRMINCEIYIPKNDPGRVRNEAFFAKMYGINDVEVKKNLKVIYWMPLYFGNKYPLLVTSINGVSTKLNNVSNQLELLILKHPDYIKYLDNPGGTFYWRQIENSKRISSHSFGIAIDINANNSDYWLWDTGIQKNELNQTDMFPYKNRIPCEIVTIFEDNGFIWGGKWQHYDTMHFEYRPELLLK